MTANVPGRQPAVPDSNADVVKLQGDPGRDWSPAEVSTPRSNLVMQSEYTPVARERFQEPRKGPSGTTEPRTRYVGFLERFHPDLYAAAMQSTAMLYVVLPYPPTTNHLYATVRGRRVKSARAREYEALCAAAVREAIEPTEPLPLPPFCLVMHLWTPDRRPRDLDGCLKAPIDNVFRVLKTPDYPIDDSQIQEMHVYKALDRERPRLEMILSQWREPAAPLPVAGGER